MGTQQLPLYLRRTDCDVTIPAPSEIDSLATRADPPCLGYWTSPALLRRGRKPIRRVEIPEARMANISSGGLRQKAKPTIPDH